MNEREDYQLPNQKSVRFLTQNQIIRPSLHEQLHLSHFLFSMTFNEHRQYIGLLALVFNELVLLTHPAAK